MVDERVAQCGCGRLNVRVTGQPLFVVACHCDFCQRQTGSVVGVVAYFGEDQVVEISGEPKVYNGLEIDGVGIAGSDVNSVSLHFCGTCGSTVYRLVSQMPGAHGIAVGAFVDPDFPPPTTELWSELRQRWLAPIPDAKAYDQFAPSKPPR